MRQGKTNILIAVPSDKIAADWIEPGVPLGLEISKLKDYKDSSRGIVVTTYANLGANDALAGREWDMVVTDETLAHADQKDGTPTTYLENLRAITLHPDGAHQRYAMLNREDIDRMKALSSQIISTTALPTPTFNGRGSRLARQEKRRARERAQGAGRQARPGPRRGEGLRSGAPGRRRPRRRSRQRRSPT